MQPRCCRIGGIVGRTMARDHGGKAVNSDAATQGVGNRVSSRLTSQPATKDSNRLVWNSGDPTDWNSQVIVIAIIDSTPQAGDRGGQCCSGTKARCKRTNSEAGIVRQARELQDGDHSALGLGKVGTQDVMKAIKGGTSTPYRRIIGWESASKTGKMKRREIREMEQRGETEYCLSPKERDWGLSI